jgi:hypothetical protein
VVPGRRDDLASLERAEDPVLADRGFLAGPAVGGHRIARRRAERALTQIEQRLEVILDRELADLGPGQLSFSMISSGTE